MIRSVRVRVIKISFSVETFSTLLTVERALSSINSHMDFKVSMLIKTLSTLTACVQLFSSVNSHIGFHDHGFHAHIGFHAE